MGSAGSVLVVDDVEATRYVMTTWLKGAGFEVLEAGCGADALSKLRSDLDVVVLDVHLPDISGPDVCAAIKRDPRTATIPVMHVSATAVDVASRVRGLNGGAEVYLTEPLDSEEFVATVQALARSRRDRRDEVHRAERLSTLAMVSLPINAARNVTALLEAAVHAASELFATAALAAATTEDGRVARSFCRAPAQVPRTTIDDTPLELPALPGALGTEQLPPAWAPLLAGHGLASRRWQLLTPPQGNRRLGAWLAVAVPGKAGELSFSEARLGEHLASMVQLAMANRREMTEEHSIAYTLQRAMLPMALPDVRGLEIAARYRASMDHLSVGGDFYDALELGDAGLVLAIGDVQGHSLRAASVMAELRYALHAYLAEGHDPASTLQLLDKLLRQKHPDHLASLALVSIGRAREVLTVVNAGHLPPLLAAAGTATFLERPHGALLGSVAAPRMPAVSVPLPGQFTLVLVTDGLIERRDQPLDLSLAALRSAVLAAPALRAEELADALLERFCPGGVEDDVALLVVRRSVSGSSGSSPAAP